MTELATDKIAARLEEAAEAIERSLKRTRRSLGSVAADMSEESRTAVEREWIALKKDLSDLMNRKDLAASPELKAVVERIHHTMNTVTDTVAEAASQAQQRAREGADRMNEYAHASPWQAAGIAAAAGFVVGVLLSRK
jgi:ElaB protein